MKHAEENPDDLGKLVHDAFERMTPSVETEERLLASLLAAQEGRGRAIPPSDMHGYAGGRRAGGGETNRLRADVGGERGPISVDDGMRHPIPVDDGARRPHAVDDGARHSHAVAQMGLSQASEPRAKRPRPADLQAKRLRIAAASLAACCIVAAIGIAAMLGFAEGIGFQTKTSGTSSADLQSALSAGSSSEESAGTTDDEAPADVAESPDEGDAANGMGEDDAGSIGMNSDEPGGNAAGSDGSPGDAATAGEGVRCPHVALGSGETLEIAKSGEAYVAAKARDIGEFLDTAIASNDLGETVSCYVFSSVEGSSYPYVVSFDGSSALYFALSA